MAEDDDVDIFPDPDKVGKAAYKQGQELGAKAAKAFGEVLGDVFKEVFSEKDALIADLKTFSEMVLNDHCAARSCGCRLCEEAERLRKKVEAHTDQG